MSYRCIVALPPIPPADAVTARRLAVVLSGPVNGYNVTLGVTETTHEFVVSAGEAVTVALVHINAAGESAPRTVSGTAPADPPPDPVPPAQPGLFTLAFVPNEQPPPSARRLLGAGDVTYLGKFPGIGWDGNSASGLIYRRVNGQGRFGRLDFLGNIAGQMRKYDYREYAVPAAFDQPITPVQNFGDVWDGTYGGAMSHNGLYYEEETGRLIHAGALDYPMDDVSQFACTCLSSRVLRDDGTITDRTGYHGIEGVGQRAMYGGAAWVPGWFRAAHGVRYLLGFGGYSSLMAQGLGPAMGPQLMFTTNDPFTTYAGLPWGSTTHTIPAAAVKFAGDYRNVPGVDWYPGGYAARTYDRGIQVTPVINYLDGGDPRPNPPTPPTDPPVPSGQWLSPAPGDPDNWNRASWPWKVGGVAWVDDNAGTRAVHGVLAVVTCAKGKAYYQSSSVHSDSAACEFHVYDPADLAAAMADQTGRLAKLLRPRAAWVVELPGFCETEIGGITGVALDRSADILYITASVCGPRPVTEMIYAFKL